ncbi:hypothetical protein RRG08_002609 [Elysia crispata]|uniref:Uncharacterized protein n=1 Tax=Elysia crispata TaxID=231223 RepID=A0AAE0Y4P9_9GAST|nr:hypothetical protein RRG08_002609 [Elysia crispata]
MALPAEIPGVNTAVERLQELGDRMRSDDFGFRNNDIGSLDKIIDAMTELEAERKGMHQKLETETIKASILRYDLKILPGIIRDEIMVAVNAARQSNVDALKDLQEQLDKMNNNMAELEVRARELERENAILHPERELLKQQHEEIISQLNQKMADKATMQIALNETRDKVRQANQDIVDLEDGILQLKEDLIQERTEARHEKKRLKKAVIDTKTKTKEQKEQNVEKKRELDTNQERLTDSEGRLDSIRKSIRRYEAARSKMETDEGAFTTQLRNQLKSNEQLRKRGMDIINETTRERQEFEVKQKELGGKIKSYETDILKETDKTSRLDQRRIALNHELKDKERIQEEDALYVQELDEQLQTVKRNLTEKAEGVGRMQTENIEMEKETEALAESHKAVLAQLNKQIEEYREQLGRERKERIELQESKDEVGKNLDDIKMSQQQFMSAITEKIQDGKRKHVQLSNEGVSLQKEIKDDEAEIDTMSSELVTAQQNYEQMFTTMQDKVDRIKKEIETMESDIEGRKSELTTKTPVFKDLEAFYHKRSEEYDAMKKLIVSLKNKKLGLEDSIKRAKDTKEGLKTPQEVLRTDLKNHRTRVMSQIKQHGTGMQDLEQQIFSAGCQLRLVMEENQRFEEACKKLERELSELDSQRQENEKIKLTSQNDLTRQKSELSRKWDADNMMQEFFASRDQATAEAFGRLLDKTGKRENKIDEITEKLRDELGMLSEFLDNIASRRPEEEAPKSKEKAALEGSRPDSTSGIETVADANLASPHPPVTPSLASHQGGSPDPRLSPDMVKSPRSIRFAAASEVGSARSGKSRGNSVRSGRSGRSEKVAPPGTMATKTGNRLTVT